MTKRSPQINTRCTHGKSFAAGALAGLWMMLAVGCGGSGSGGDDDPAPVVQYSVGGAVSGLDDSASVVLRNNSGDDLTISGNGNFSFATPVAQGGAYDVTVLTQPAAQTCTVNNGSGTIDAADIADVQVVCSTNSYSVGGVLSGLSGSVVLQNNGADNLSLTSDGAFTFATAVAQAATYNVTVLTQPATQTCVVANASGTISGANVANVGLSCTLNSTTLSVSIADIALSVTGLTEHGLGGNPASGIARKVSVTNTGSFDALNIAVTAPTWPAGTTSSTSCGSVLAPAGTCDITVTPGSVASSDGTNPCSVGTAPNPGVVQVTADNTNTVSSNVVVLNYGCIYQGGYVYALDDTMSTSQSVGGKVMTISDQAPAYPGGAIWSSNGINGDAANVVFDNIYGVTEDSVPGAAAPNTGFVSGQNACNGATDGACNTNNIVVYYQTAAISAPINSTYYAAGLCTQTIAGYLDWYLPAVCELGYGSPACGTALNPTLQNMQSNLVDLNNIPPLAGGYWSSTSFSAFSQINAWGHFFDYNSFQFQSVKSSDLDVKCSRKF